MSKTETLTIAELVHLVNLIGQKLLDLEARVESLEKQSAPDPLADLQ